METIIDLLHSGKYSCVIMNKTGVRTFNQRGVADLYDLYEHEPVFMQGASIADKVVGKAAATLMVLGGVKYIYADIISEPAASLLHKNNIEVEYTEIVPFIENRDKTGWCPLESACQETESEEGIYLVIQNFISSIRNKPLTNG